MTFQDLGVTNNEANAETALHRAQIRQVQKARKVRATFFGEDMFADPAWDMLLELYACQLSQQRVSISGASAAAGVPPTTALRWITVLEQKNFITRENDPLDGRRVWISLTSHGAFLMRRYFMATSIDPSGL